MGPTGFEPVVYGLEVGPPIGRIVVLLRFDISNFPEILTKSLPISKKDLRPKP
jgi:hypothetical protein